MLFYRRRERSRLLFYYHQEGSIRIRQIIPGTPGMGFPTAASPVFRRAVLDDIICFFLTWKRQNCRFHVF
ncbi:hypothetical protein CXT91_03350 [Akkermansia muciniphila]|nr:hypothetical protein CXT97_09470 [Akkermansia muciniphila]PNC91927.1 hypothetical protein CXT91_03350 [Akkermansia muciniphila]